MKKAKINEELYFEIWDHLSWLIGEKKVGDSKAVKMTAKTFTIPEREVEDVLDALKKLYDSSIKASEDKSVALRVLAAILLQLKASLIPPLTEVVSDSLDRGVYWDITIGDKDYKMQLTPISKNGKTKIFLSDQEGKKLNKHLIAEILGPEDKSQLQKKVKQGFDRIWKFMNSYDKDFYSYLTDEAALQKLEGQNDRWMLNNFKDQEIVMIGAPPKGWSTSRFQQVLESFGTKVSKSFTKKTTLALINDKIKRSDKITKVEEAGIQIMPYITLIDTLENLHLAREAAGVSSLKSSDRNKLNKKIIEFLEPTYFSNIPLDGIFNILDSLGVVALQEDNTKWQGILAGKEGSLFVPIAPKDSDHGDNEDPFFEPYKNSMLKLTYYKMPSGNYEVIAYVT